MNENTIAVILTSVLGSSVVTAWLTGWFDREKRAAETKKIQADAEITFADGWRDFALEMKREMDSMRTELGAIHNKYLHLEKQYNDLQQQYDNSIEKIKGLSLRLSKYEANI